MEYQLIKKRMSYELKNNNVQGEFLTILLKVI